MTWLSNFREKRRNSKAVNEHSAITPLQPTSTPHTYLPLASSPAPPLPTSTLHQDIAGATYDTPAPPTKPPLTHIPTEIITATENGMMSGSSLSRYTGFESTASSSVPSSTASTVSATSQTAKGEAKDLERVMTRGEEACGDEDEARRPGGRRATGRSVLFKGVDV